MGITVTLRHDDDAQFKLDISNDVPGGPVDPAIVLGLLEWGRGIMRWRAINEYAQRLPLIDPNRLDALDRVAKASAAWLEMLDDGRVEARDRAPGWNERRRGRLRQREAAESTLRSCLNAALGE